MRTILLALLIPLTLRAIAAEPCQQIHGRAHYYFADGQFRLWHIGTNHEFSLMYSESSDRPYPVDERILDMLRAGTKTPADISENDLFADFLVCPLEHYRKRAAQAAYVEKMNHPRMVHTPWVEPKHN